MKIAIALAVGFVLDAVFGDPEKLYHPVRLIGLMISKGEKLMRRLLPGREFLAGAILTVLVCAVSFAVPLLILVAFARVSPWLAAALQAVWCWRILAAKSLKDESLRVMKYLNAHDLPNSRKYLSYIVGRDTESLNETQVTKAVVETVAENTSDGVIAPLIYFALGGAPLAFLYKAVNTLDSMIGYKNDKYLYFGRFAAKTDDVFNFIPAIISAHLMMLVCPLCSLDGKNARKIYARDRHNHASPNSAKCESVAAGALGVMLAGNAYYFGKLYEKPTIGDSLRPIEPKDISRTVRLMYAAATAGAVIFCVLRALIVWII